METKQRITVKSLSKRLDNIQAKGRKHRLVNSLFVICLLVATVFLALEAPEHIEEMDHESEVGNIMMHEGMKLKRIKKVDGTVETMHCKYMDSRGYWTIGHGHKMTSGEKYEMFGDKECISTYKAIEILYQDYDRMRSSVEKRYPWASGEVKLVLINMTFQLGETGLSKYQMTLMSLQVGDYKRAAAEMLNSAHAVQTPNRVLKISSRILQLDSSWW